MGLIDLFKEFHSRAIVNAYPVSVRALFDYFLYDFNAAFWTEERIYSERELSKMTCLTPSSIHRALKFLAERGHIKVRASKRGTVIMLVEHKRSTDEAQAKHKRSTSEAVSGVFNIRAREDIKTEDIKTNNNDDGAGANTQELDEVLEYWEAQGGGRLTFEHQSELAAWLAKKGLLWLKEAIKTAADSNNNPRGISFNYLKAIVQNKLNAQPSAQKPAKTLVDDMLNALDEQIKW